MSSPKNKQKALDPLSIPSLINGHYRLVSLIGIIVFAMIGSYFFVFSHAATNPSNEIYIQNLTDGSNVQSIQVGALDGSVLLYVNTVAKWAGEGSYPPSGQMSGALAVSFADAINGSNVPELNAFDCPNDHTCTSSAARNGAGSVQNCIILNDTDFSKAHLYLGRLHFSNINGQKPTKLTIVQTNTCLADPDAMTFYPNYFLGRATIGVGMADSISKGSSPEGTGNGRGVGGASSAKKQSNTPNTIPSTTAQGTTSQPDLEPSPFFDGKQYDPGSDPDILGVNTSFAIAGHNLKYGWLLMSILFVGLGSAATYFFWWRKHHFKK